MGRDWHEFRSAPSRLPGVNAMRKVSVICHRIHHDGAAWRYNVFHRISWRHFWQQNRATTVVFISSLANSTVTPRHGTPPATAVRVPLSLVFTERF